MVFMTSIKLLKNSKSAHYTIIAINNVVHSNIRSAVLKNMQAR